MEVFPKHTGTKTFQQPQYQEWKYQKPYLLNVFKGVQHLLDNKMAMTDLKPENTLYDVDSRKAVIIDLGGVKKFEEADKFDTSGIQLTEKYAAK